MLHFDRRAGRPVGQNRYGSFSLVICHNHGKECEIAPRKLVRGCLGTHKNKPHCRKNFRLPMTSVHEQYRYSLPMRSSYWVFIQDRNEMYRVDYYTNKYGHNSVLITITDPFLW